MDTNSKSKLFGAQPDDINQTVWRYVDAVKLIHLLTQKKLFFCRLDLLEDAKEGMFPPEMLEQWLKSFGKIVQDDADLLVKIGEFFSTKFLPKGIFVNSWCGRTCEDALLWYRYAGSGFAIRTTYGKLQKSFRTTGATHKPNIGLVKYASFNTVSLDEVKKLHGEESHLLSTALIKDSAYEGEHEVRCMILNYPPANSRGALDDNSWDDHVQGIDVEVDVEVLIEEIVASPWTETWIIDLIKSICISIGLDVKVSKSTVAIR